jgi:hypothetical protein
LNGKPTRVLCYLKLKPSYDGLEAIEG